MRKLILGIVCLLFLSTSVILPGCGKRAEDSAAKNALKWKKSKEGELTGDDAERGE
ncbi:MAG: hypothetical protein GW893_22655 [Armatimonadetes bacterium]|nr:hypothetical protein [Armatimonadota bacterium]